MQGPENKLTGHIEQDFDEILGNMESFIRSGCSILLKLWKDYFLSNNEWLVNCHKIRVHSFLRNNGIPVPERIHKDGAEFVVMACVNRINVTGGVSLLYANPESPPLFGVTLMPGDAIVVNDRNVYHMVTPLQAESEEGYRDMIIMGFHKWSSNKYPSDWQNYIY